MMTASCRDLCVRNLSQILSTQREVNFGTDAV